MRDRADVILTAVVSAFALCGMTALALTDVDAPVQPSPTVTVVIDDPPAAATGAAWLVEMRPYCNSVDIETRMRWAPPPTTSDGAMHGAACLALAGRIDEARTALRSLPQDEQWKGAGVVFEVGHPAADAGDDLAAGPLMELVVEF